MSIIKQQINLEKAWELVLKQLEQASEDPGHAFRYVTLATVSSGNAPSQRMVVLREFNKDDMLFTIFTDSRSDKVEEIRTHETVSLYFYDYEEKLQVRICGPASVITEGNRKMKYWRDSGSKGAHSYTSFKSPGEIIHDPEEAYAWDLENANHFCVIEIKAESMKFLQLNGHRHIRASQHFSDGSWKQYWIAP